MKHEELSRQVSELIKRVLVRYLPLSLGYTPGTGLPRKENMKSLKLLTILLVLI
jgi:hypothetical protein